MENEEIKLKIGGRALSLSAEGLSSLEVSRIADQVEKKIEYIEECTKTTDFAKLALMAALEFAIKLYNLEQKFEEQKKELKECRLQLQK